MENMDLSTLRQQIDLIDTKLVQLLNERARVSLSIGKVKKEGGRFVRKKFKSFTNVSCVTISLLSPVLKMVIAITSMFLAEKNKFLRELVNPLFFSNLLISTD